jgi:hypothetical protein
MGNVNSLVNKYESRYSDISDYLAPERNFGILLDLADDALIHFGNSMPMADDWFYILEESLRLANEFFRNAIPTIVHGDVSQANIFQFSGELVLIDWEDSFWGFRGYDQLYWMTFLQNAKELTSLNLAKLDLDFEVCQAILNIIILLKEYLHRNTIGREKLLTFEQRLKMAKI